ncbi:MAG: phage integrase family protein [Bacteroidetes bacterium]|nr:phage integrase family protein [Bacteroidota bacterium]
MFSSTELELLLEREERYQDLKLRNQAVISLLIYQGLTVGEISRLKVDHIDLDKGIIFIKNSRKNASRHLEIMPRQYRILDRYIHESRKKLLKSETDCLAIGKLGTVLSKDDIHYLVSTYKGLFPDRNLNPQTIRQSVISNWMNEKKLPLEQVQLMAGHKWISSTIKYRQTNVEEQRELMNKWFPID